MSLPSLLIGTVDNIWSFQHLFLIFCPIINVVNGWNWFRWCFKVLNFEKSEPFEGLLELQKLQIHSCCCSLSFYFTATQSPDCIHSGYRVSCTIWGFTSTMHAKTERMTRPSLPVNEPAGKRKVLTSVKTFTGFCRFKHSTHAQIQTYCYEHT